MGKTYGLPYKGSKSRIAEELIDILPSGERFVDLCAGGGAMTHATLLSGKYKTVLFNDIDPLAVDLFKNAAGGLFSYDTFKPKFITRENFYKYKDQSGYIKYVWSFGNNGRDYLFSKEKEPLKKAAHDLIVFGTYSEELEQLMPNVCSSITGTDIHERRAQFMRYCRSAQCALRVQALERIGRIQETSDNLQRTIRGLEITPGLFATDRTEKMGGLKAYHNIEYASFSLFDYEYQIGDVVYIDPPYNGTDYYGMDFDSHAFYDWVATRPFTVYFSEGDIDDQRFDLIWSKENYSTLSATNNSYVKKERLYKNRVR